ncbi:hypothetical protein BKA81DRAFT_366677 [Phyllosticta paracitricarpa]
MGRETRRRPGAFIGYGTYLAKPGLGLRYLRYRFSQTLSGTGWEGVEVLKEREVYLLQSLLSIGLALLSNAKMLWRSELWLIISISNWPCVIVCIALISRY